MNSLITTNPGQMPLYLDDLRFLDTIYKSGLEAILKTHANNTNCILFGCEQTWNGEEEVTVSAGAVWLGNEIFAFEGGSLAEVDLIPSFQITQIDDSPRVFGDGSVHNVHRLRNVILVNTGSITLSSLKTYKQIVKDNSNLPGDWQTLSYNAKYGDWGTFPMKFRTLNNGTQLQLVGNVQKEIDAGYVMGILPVGYRPTGDVMILVSKGKSMNGDEWIMIRPSGEILFPNFVNESTFFNFNHIIPI